VEAAGVERDAAAVAAVAEQRLAEGGALAAAVGLGGGGRASAGAGAFADAGSDEAGPLDDVLSRVSDLLGRVNGILASSGGGGT
jgi:hypothetical protein